MKEIKILSVGNSFSDDTMEHLYGILSSLGYEKIKLGNLYIGGCSINQHLINIETNAKKYDYRVNIDGSWVTTPCVSSVDAIKSDAWDWISVQPGTADGSRVTDTDSYKNLPKLVEKIRSFANNTPNLAFTMTWLGEPTNTHPEIVSYNGDIMKMYSLHMDIIKNTISPLNLFNAITPIGTAVQNARTSGLTTIYRDGYHLSWLMGRYMAGLTFVKALLGEDISSIEFAPEGVSETEKTVAIESAASAINSPFEITRL